MAPFMSIQPGAMLTLTVAWSLGWLEAASSSSALKEAKASVVASDAPSAAANPSAMVAASSSVTVW